MKEDVITRVSSSYLFILTLVVLDFSKTEIIIAILMFAILDIRRFMKEL